MNEPKRIITSNSQKNLKNAEGEVITPIHFERPVQKDIITPIHFVDEGTEVTFEDGTSGRYDGPAQENTLPKVYDSEEFLPAENAHMPAEITESLEAFQNVNMNFQNTLFTPCVQQNSITVNVPHRMVSPAVCCNFDLWPTGLLIYINRDGQPDSLNSFVEFTIEIDAITYPKVKIAFSDIDYIAKKVKDNFPWAITENSAQDKQIANAFRKKLANVPQSLIYHEMGWQYFGGNFRYVHDNMPGQTDLLRAYTGKSIPYNPNIKLSDIISDIKNLTTNDELTMILLTTPILSILFTFFDSAGYTPRFVTFVTGPTGSFKTALSTLFFSFVYHGNLPREPFKIAEDTPTAVEIAMLEEGYDSIVIFDDYAPQSLSDRIRTQKKNLEVLIRLVGDCQSKSRANCHLNLVRGRRNRGLAIITGELEGSGHSSRLRTMYIRINRSQTNVEMLSKLQSTPYPISTLIYHFILWAEVNFRIILEIIGNEFNTLRNQLAHHGLSDFRTIDATVQRVLTIKIFNLFMKDNNITDDLFIQKMADAAFKNALYNESNNTDEPIGNVLMQTISEILAKKSWKVKASPLTYEEVAFYDGFEENGKMYITPRSFFNVLRTYMPSDKLSNYRDDDIKNILSEKGVLVSFSNGKKRTFRYKLDLHNGTTNKTSLSFLCINLNNLPG